MDNLKLPDTYPVFSDWVAEQTDELKKAGEGYDTLSELSKQCIDYAVERYLRFLIKANDNG